MARKIFILGISVMAAALGVIGYQALTYHFYGNWPAVSSQFVYGELFGDLPALKWSWANDLLLGIGKLPVSAVGILLCYLLLLASDLLRGRDRRRAS